MSWALSIISKKSPCKKAASTCFLMSSHTLDRHSILQTSDLEGAALNGEERCEGLEHPQSSGSRQIIYSQLDRNERN